MNEKQARLAGYEFEGTYNLFEDEVKTQAALLRRRGNKAIVVYSKPNSRGCHGGGYSVYWVESKANKEARLQEERSQRIGQLQTQRESLLAQIAEIDRQLEVL